MVKLTDLLLIPLSLILALLLVGLIFGHGGYLADEHPELLPSGVGLSALLQATFSPFEVGGTSLSLGRYVGGPWEPVGTYRFG